VKRALSLPVSAATVGALVVAACGGQSMLHSDDDSGNGGDAGAAQGGFGGTSSGSGGTSSGDAGSIPVGGSSSGGFAGTIDTGGSGGTSFGGSSFGGVAGTSGSAGIAGAGGVCSLPLASGQCDAYFPSFGFSTADGNCQPFVYGGCGGNDNRFSTLAECEAKCGGSTSSCPAEQPLARSACKPSGQTCAYQFDGCLCAPKVTPPGCVKIDASCIIDGGIAGIVYLIYTRCSCLNGAWQCDPVYGGGGPL
jgi:hypothetical protein